MYLNHLFSLYKIVFKNPTIFKLILFIFQLLQVYFLLFFFNYLNFIAFLSFNHNEILLDLDLLPHFHLFQINRIPSLCSLKIIRIS